MSTQTRVSHNTDNSYAFFNNPFLRLVKVIYYQDNRAKPYRLQLLIFNLLDL